MEMSMIGKVQEQLGEAGLIAVVRADGKEAAEETIHRLIDKGITAIEITYTTPGASELIEKFAGKDGLLVGAGTVVESEQARKPRQRVKIYRQPGFSESLAEEAASLHTFLFPAY